MYRRRSCRAASALGILVVAAAASGDALPDDAGQLTETEFLDPMPRVLTATRLRQPALESPSSVTVITRRMIRNAGIRDVAEILRLVPGFQVEYFDASKPVVTYHGTADDFARRLQVLVDGRTIYTPLFGGVLWSNVPLAVEDIERVEVIRSPNAASYGPNSFSAIVNIITAHPATETGVDASVTVGQGGQRDAFARAAGRAGDARYRLSYAHAQDDGFEANNHPDQRDFDRLTGRVDYDEGSTNLMLKAGLGLGDEGRGREGDRASDGDTDIPRERELRAAYAHARWTRELGTGRSVSLQYYVNYDRWIDDTRYGPRNDFSLPGLDNPRVRVDLNARSRRHDLEAVYRTRPLPGLRLVAGAGARRDSVESRWLFGTDEPQSNDVYRLFGHAEYRVRPRTTLHLGALVEENDLVDTTTSPRLALVQKTAPYHRLRLSVSYATRTPVIFEADQERYFVVRSDNRAPFRVYTDYTADDDLEPERTRAVELGYRIDHPGRHWDMDVKLFEEHLDDLLVEVETRIPASAPPDSVSFDPVTGYTNGLSGVRHGVEGQLTIYPAEDLDLRFWGSRASLVQVRAVNEDVADEHRASVPHTTFGMSAEYRLAPTRTLSLDYYYIDRMSWVDKRDENGVDRLDLQYRETWPSIAPSAFLALRLDNLLGEYAEYDDDNIVDTRLSLRAGVRF